MTVTESRESTGADGMLDFDSCYRAVTARDRRFDGRFFTGVISTGIYCRPVCPARTPARTNVRFFRYAAAAEAAGFRPCRRCRPELSPGDPGWNARADLVGRALRLIDDGVVDECGVAGLARRLHVTERHLHRLFTAELGTGPLAVARTRRLLLAKQLLTETTLPITEVAFASGFGSVRQFNASMKEAYGFTPGDLRLHPGGGRPDRLVFPSAREPVSHLTLRLYFRPPYDWDAMMAFLSARAIPGVEEADGTRYTRNVPGGTITITWAVDHLRLQVSMANVRQLARIVSRCRRLFDLDADPDAIATALGGTSLGPLVRARPGLRVPGAFDGFEMAVRAVVGQRTSVAAARTLLGRIAERAGSPGLFPTAEQLAEADLTGLGLSEQRIATLTALARSVAAGEIDLDGAQDPAETEQRLLALPGIGPWTADYIAMRALRDPDAWPRGDLVLGRTLNRLGIPADELDRWRPWRAYAALHVWNAS